MTPVEQTPIIDQLKPLLLLLKPYESYLSSFTIRFVGSLTVIFLSYMLYLWHSKRTGSSKASALPFDKSIGNKTVIFTQNESYKKVEKIKIKLVSAKDKRVFELNKDRLTKTLDISQGISYNFQFQTKKDGSLFWSWWSPRHYFIAEEPPYFLKTDPCEEDFQQTKLSLEQVSPCNFLVLGKIGNGKSSWINTIFTAYNEKWTEKAQTSSANFSVTDKMKAYEVIPGRIKLFDLPGWEKDYGFDLIPEIIKGKCPNITRRNMKNGEYDFDTEGGPTKIDTVVFIVSAATFEEDLEINNKIMEQINKSGTSKFCVISYLYYI